MRLEANGDHISAALRVGKQGDRIFRPVDAGVLNKGMCIGQIKRAAIAPRAAPVQAITGARTQHDAIRVWQLGYALVRILNRR